MQLQTLVPIPPALFAPPTSTARVDLAIDLAANLVTVTVTTPGHATRLQDQRPIPPALLTTLTNHAKLVGEALLGVAPGSTTVIP